MTADMNDKDDEDAKWICADCIAEPYLSKLVLASATTATCSYCGLRNQPCWSIDTLADKVQQAFEQHFERTSDQPDGYQEMLLRDKESSYTWYRDGEPVVDAVEFTAKISREAAEDVVEVIAERNSDWDKDLQGTETEFSSESHYQERSDYGSTLRLMWFPFEQSVKTQARFFNRVAADYLAEVFKNLDRLKTKSGKRVIVSAGPKSSLKYLYRARVIFGEASLEEALARPNKKLGPPPPSLASAGRMNARGVAVFYAATNRETAIAEVRPPVGSDVVVAKFAVTRPLRILDLTRLEQATATGSVFDPEFSDRLERVGFLQALNQLMTRPVMPGDESLEYVTTQAVADYLATAYQPVIDGIVYRSAQVKVGKNVVLFNHAARVQELDLPEGTTTDVTLGHGTDEGWEVDFHVTDRVPSPSKAEPETHDASLDFLFDIPVESSLSSTSPYFMDWDQRVPSLDVDIDSIVVHHVEWVRFGASKETVRRTRFAAKQ